MRRILNNKTKEQKMQLINDSVKDNIAINKMQLINDSVKGNMPMSVIKEKIEEVVVELVMKVQYEYNDSKQNELIEKMGESLATFCKVISGNEAEKLFYSTYNEFFGGTNTEEMWCDIDWKKCQMTENVIKRVALAMAVRDKTACNIISQLSLKHKGVYCD